MARNPTQRYIDNEKSGSFFTSSIIYGFDLIDSVIDEASGVDYTIKFKEEKKYKSFSEKFGVGKWKDLKVT